MTVARVSGCDANYFPILLEWVHSVRRFPQSKGMAICIMDVGLTKEQCEILAPMVEQIVAPDWPCELPDYKIRGREYLKACVCRPFIPQIFPGYETYFWMDADTWVQNWDGPALFLQGAERGGLSIASQTDRSYTRTFRVKWLGRLPWKIRGFYYSNAIKAFGFKTAKKLLPYPVLQAGAFAMKADIPHWKHWQELVLGAMQRGKVFTAEQLCLGVMCYLDGYSCEILPAWTHWMCEFKPLWDEEKRVFVEPHLPNETLGILHISGFDEMRLDRREVTHFNTLQGDEVRLSYRNPHYDGEKQEAAGEGLAA